MPRTTAQASIQEAIGAEGPRTAVGYQALAWHFQADVEMHAVRPDVDVFLAFQGTPARLLSILVDRDFIRRRPFSLHPRRQFLRLHPRGACSRSASANAWLLIPRA